MAVSDQVGPGWYFTRKEIEENSPSRRDDIDLKKETYLRKSYCTFLQELGMRLKVPQVTIATAIVFCHRFFIRQSHAKNDRRAIATVCMFLAGKVEETPHALKDVIIVSYEIIHKRNQSAAQRIKQKEVYEQQKELILRGERLVLVTLNFNLNVVHPYRPLVQAIKKFKVPENALARVAWNFVNDGLRTSLCLQFKPDHIAAGAIFLAAKFIKVKLPSDGDRAWWQEFDVTPRQLEEVSNQILELYDRSTVQSSNPPGAELSTGGGTNWPTATTSTVSEHPRSVSAQSQAMEIIDAKVAARDLADSRVGSKRSSENQIRDYTQDGGLQHTTDHRKNDRFLREGRPFDCNSENTTAVTSSVSSLGQLERGPASGEKGSGFHEATKDVNSALDAFMYAGDNKAKSGIEKRRKTGHNVIVETEHEAESAMHGIKAHDVGSLSARVTNRELES